MHAIAVASLFVAASLGAQQPSGRGGGRGMGGVAIQPGEQCPQGMTEVRPRRCAAPEFAPPSILDYRPRSTLKTVEHLVKTAKYPAIDYHGHPGQLIMTAQGLDSLGAALDSLNVRVMVSADNLSGDRLRRALAAIKASPKMHDRVRVLAGIDFRNVGPGWAQRAVAQLDSDMAAGAVGVGEIPKSLGLSIRKPDGSRLRIDDPELDPIWDECARLGIPVFIHTADPQEFFQPIDYNNERWLELSLFADRRYPQDRFPSFEELSTERDNLFRKHRNVTFVAAHMGWIASDLPRLSAMLDQMPNVVTEVGAVLYDIGRQPRNSHDFFVKYQDRILFGKDSFQPEEYPYYWRVFETKDDYFDYYRPYHAFWKLYGIDLPDPVLKKVYFQNAMRITKGIPQGGWPK
ncbi:MAG TPA: amidohydrolase family protein [Gemmatimonadaceae bacterium]|jgi:predicted TIM-barrel fold metal-dependent hydrolase|nr:amidohydrolase family protein [Gemmatimonadaceae bacterium]